MFKVSNGSIVMFIDEEKAYLLIFFFIYLTFIINLYLFIFILIKILNKFWRVN